MLGTITFPCLNTETWPLSKRTTVLGKAALSPSVMASEICAAASHDAAGEEKEAQISFIVCSGIIPLMLALVE